LVVEHDQAAMSHSQQLELTADEHAMLAGAQGDVAQWAITMQVEVGRFFGARRMVPVTCAHMMGDIEVMGDPGLDLLEDLERRGAQFRVPVTTNARCVDFDAAERLLQKPDMVAKEHALIAFLKRIGVTQTDTCINYQTVYQPHFGEHVAWGDTGTVIYANSILGARSNYESGPAAFAAGITGRTPAYGFHLDENRRGTVLVEVDAALDDLADWGALGAAIGRRCNDYWQVPVIDGVAELAITPDRLKHLGASLASYGSLAMFHMVGVTPEARTREQALGGRAPARTLRIDDAAIRAVYDSYPADRDEIDLVVLTGPQLSLFELKLVSELLAGRKVHANTRLIITTNRQNRDAGRALGYVETIERAGGLVLVGVCFYLMGAGDMRERFGWSNILTNSAKLANIIGGYRYHPIFRRTAACVEAAVTGRLP
jgi:predicted aconitase